MQAAGWLKQVIDADKPARVFIDVGGVGAGVYDRMRDAVALTFAEPAAPRSFARRIEYPALGVV